MILGGPGRCDSPLSTSHFRPSVDGALPPASFRSTATNRLSPGPDAGRRRRLRRAPSRRRQVGCSAAGAGLSRSTAAFSRSSEPACRCDRPREEPAESRPTSSLHRASRAGAGDRVGPGRRRASSAVERDGTWADREVGSDVETVVRGRLSAPPRNPRAGVRATSLIARLVAGQRA